MSEMLRIEMDGPVAHLILNRPEKRNALSAELVEHMYQAMLSLNANDSLRVVVIRSADKPFCAGADLVEFKRYLENEHAAAQEPYNARVLFPVTQKVAACRLPVIAAINGGATAGGLDFALACDIRIASTAAKMGETYIKLGLAPGNGGTYFLPRLVGSGMAAEMALTGDIVDAQRALEIGLVNQIVEPDALIATAVALAARIAERPRLAIEATKQQLRQSWHMDLQTSMNASFWAVAALTYSDDLREGVNAGLEKRTPEYNRPKS